MKNKSTYGRENIFFKYLLSMAMACFIFLFSSNVFIMKTGSTKEWGLNHSIFDMFFISLVQFIPTFILFSAFFAVPSILIYKYISLPRNYKYISGAVIGVIFGFIGVYVFSFVVSLFNDISIELFHADLFIIPLSGLIGGVFFCLATSPREND